jgi:hypothetical protein
LIGSVTWQPIALEIDEPPNPGGSYARVQAGYVAAHAVRSHVNGLVRNQRIQHGFEIGQVIRKPVRINAGGSLGQPVATPVRGIDAALDLQLVNQELK